MNYFHPKITKYQLSISPLPHRHELLLRIFFSESKVDLGEISIGCLRAENWTKLREATEIISRMPLCIVDEPAISITTLETKARLMKEKTDLGLIVLVNIHLMRDEGFRPRETGKYPKSPIRSNRWPWNSKFSLSPYFKSTLNQIIEPFIRQCLTCATQASSNRKPIWLVSLS